MTKDRAQLIMKPSDCTLVFGIAASVEEYERQRLKPDRYDFMSVLDKEGYCMAVLNDMDRLLPAIAQTGARIETGVSLQGFGSLLRDPSRSVVTLFSHWKEDSVQFADGLMKIQQFIEMVPFDFRGVLDLCVCHPVGLAARLRAERPHIGFIKYIDTSATVSLWLWFYAALFRRLATEQSTWLNALAATVTEFRYVLNHAPLR